MATVYYLDANGKINSTTGTPPAGRQTYPTHAAAARALEDRRVYYVNANGTVASTVALPKPGQITFTSYSAAVAASPTHGVLSPTGTTGATSNGTGGTTTTPATARWWVDETGALHSTINSTPPAGAMLYETESAAAAVAAVKSTEYAQTQRNQMNSDMLLRDTLAQYGMSDLYETFHQYLLDGYSDEVIAIKIRESDAYKARFPGMDVLRQQGVNESYYLQYERDAAGLERAYGLPRGSLTDKSVVSQLMLANVSSKELAERVQLNVSAAMLAPPEVRNALKEMYGLSDGDIAYHFLNPNNSLAMLQKQAAAAQVRGAGVKAGVGDLLTKDMSEELGLQGVTYGVAAKAAGEAAMARSLTRGSKGLITNQQLIEGVFGDYGHADDAAALEYARASRLADFAGQGGAYLAQSGVAGAGSASE